MLRKKYKQPNLLDPYVCRSAYTSPNIAVISGYFSITSQFKNLAFWCEIEFNTDDKWSLSFHLNDDNGQWQLLNDDE